MTEIVPFLLPNRSLQRECQRSAELQDLLVAESSGHEDLVQRQQTNISDLSLRLDREMQRSSELQTLLCDEQRKVIRCAGELEQLRPACNRLEYDIVQREVRECLSSERLTLCDSLLNTEQYHINLDRDDLLFISSDVSAKPIVCCLLVP